MKAMLIFGLLMIAIVIVAVALAPCSHHEQPQSQYPDPAPDTDLGMIKSVQIIDNARAGPRAIVTTEKMIVTVDCPTIPVSGRAWLKHKRGDVFFPHGHTYFWAEGMSSDAYVLD